MNHPVDVGPAPLPSQAGPVTGIDVARLDRSRCQAVAYLFPKKRGLILFTLLLQEDGEVRSMELDGIGLVNVVVIQLRSVEFFARSHGWGKDTALRYIRILEALQLLYRRRHAEYTEILIPLAPWSPSEQRLIALDGLLIEDAARERLQQLASGVKDRFLLLYGPPQSFSSLYDELMAALVDVQDLLNKRLSATKRQLLQLRIGTLRSRLEAAAEKGDFQAISSTQKGDFHAGIVDQNEPTRTRKGDFQDDLASPSTQKGDFYSHAGGSYPPGDAEKGDFYAGPGRTYGLSPTQKGDFQIASGSQNSTIVAEKGDFQGGQQSLNTQRSTQKGDLQGNCSVADAEKEDFHGVAIGASLNDNVITIYNDISDKDGGIVIDNDAASASENPQGYPPKEAAKVGRQLAMFLEGSPANIGGFVNKCKQCSRTAIQAAVIDTLVHSAFPTIDPTDERGRPRDKAKWFHLACNEYNKPDTPIPAFIRKWLRTDLYWQDLNAYWTDIAGQLNEAERRYKRYMIAESSTADLVRRFLCGEIDQQALDEVLQQTPAVGLHYPESQTPVANGKPSASPGSTAAAKTWMEEYEAEALAEEILRDAGQQGVSSAQAKPEGGVYVVELVWKGFPMQMKTPQEWRTHYEKVQKALALQQQLGGSHGANT
jgi:hypothetical protein